MLDVWDANARHPTSSNMKRYISLKSFRAAASDKARATALKTALSILLVMPPLAYADLAQVVGVIDGDTVTVLSPEHIQTRCRLFGIDAPEKAQAFGQASKKALSDLVYRKTLDVKVVDTDRYGRSICRLTLAGVDISRQQVVLGMAWVYRRYNRELPYYEAEAAAKTAHLGLWSSTDPIPPWDYRHKVPASDRQMQN
jgi:micrococcal nuclease